MNRNPGVRPIVEGAFLALITAMLGVLAVYFLPLKFLVDYVWGIPIIIIIKKYGLRVGTLTLMTTFFLTWIFTDPVTTTVLLVQLAPLALAYGLLFKYEIPPGTVLLTGSVVCILSTGLAVLGFIYIAGVDLIPSEQFFRDQAAQIADLYTKYGVMNAAQSKAYAQSMTKLVVTLIPSMLAVGAVVRAFITYLITVKVFRKLNYRVNSLPPFSEWTLPWYSIWLVIAGLGLSLIGDQYRLHTLAVIGKNIVFLVLPLFFIIGLAVVVNFFRSWQIPRWMKIVLVILIFINLGGALVLLTIIGLFDPVVSFRKRKVPRD
ncbi:MAG TPA: YybS family protein [Desulfobacteria bacterium]|nr:YybS family protein [Desulfobacteria bacterium]